MAHRARFPSRILLATTASIVLLSTLATSHASVSYDDFSSTDGLTLNGSSTTVDNGIDPHPVLRLAAATRYVVGNTWTTEKVDISRFETTFEFRISDPGGIVDVWGHNGADGMTFTIQPISPSTLGHTGGFLGYRPTSPSVAVEIDTWFNPLSVHADDPDNSHIGINDDGTVISKVTASAPVQFDDGVLRTAEISYDGTTLAADIGGVTLSHVIDIPSIIGSHKAHVGFTASTGGAWANHDVISWKFKAIPEPTTAAIWALLGLTAVFWRRRQRRRAG